MRKLRFKDIMETVIKCVPIRLRYGLVLSGCLKLGSGNRYPEINTKGMALGRTAEKMAKKKPTLSIESVGELNIL